MNMLIHRIYYTTRKIKGVQISQFLHEHHFTNWLAYEPKVVIELPFVVHFFSRNFSSWVHGGSVGRPRGGIGIILRG